MDELLKQEVEPTRLDSHGAFTVQTRQAIEKMSRFQLPTKTFWVLKLIQAGVRSGAGEINVSPGIGTTRVTFQPAESWNLAELEQDLFQPQPSPTPALYHLKQALWSAAFAQQFPLELKLPGATRALVYSQGQLQRQKSSPGDSFRLTVTHPADPAYAREARQKACACPVPLTVGHERVDNLISQDPPVHFQILPAPDFPLAVTPNTNFPNAGSSSAGLALLISRNLSKQSSRLHWVHDGVILETYQLPIFENRLRCDLYVSTQGLRTDAGNARLIHDEGYQARRSWAQEQLLAALFQLPVQPPKPTAKMPGRLALGAVCLLVGAVNPPFVPMVAMLGGLGLSRLEANRDGTAARQDLEALKASALPAGYRPPPQIHPASTDRPADAGA